MADNPSGSAAGDLSADSAGRAALDRLLAIAQTDTGQSRCVADFLLAWWNARSCGGFDPAELWSVSTPVRDDILAVLHLIAHGGEQPTAYGHGEVFAALVRRWRPHVTESVR